MVSHGWIKKRRMIYKCQLLYSEYSEWVLMKDWVRLE
jgi:hypothetical protein